MPVNHICLDLETYKTRCPRAAAVLTEKEQADSAVDVLHAEILCSAFVTDQDEPVVFNCMPDTEQERIGLLELSETLNDLADRDTVWIGQNIKGFDLPLLLNRWRRYRIRPPEHFPIYTGRYWSGRVYDTMERTPAKNPMKGKNLAAICAAYGLEAKTVQWLGEPMTGARVAAAFEAGEHQLILDYCEQDAIDEYELYKIMTFDDRYGSYNRDNSLSETLTEIDQSELSAALKWQAAKLQLQAAGVI